MMIVTFGMLKTYTYNKWQSKLSELGEAVSRSNRSHEALASKSKI